MVNCLHACSFDVCTSGNAFTSDISMKDTVFYSCSILSKSSLCILVKRLCLDVFLYVFAPAYTVTPATSLQLFHLVESFFVYVRTGLHCYLGHIDDGRRLLQLFIL